MAKIALVTGVTREMGLGYEIAKQLVEKGYQVIIGGRDLEKVKQLAASIKVLPMQLDITSDQSIEQLAQAIDSQFGRLDVLVNNAAAFFDAGAEPLSSDMDFVKQAFDTNLLGAWRMIKAFVPLLQKSESGRIVNVSSGGGSFADPIFGMANHPNFVPVYSLTKLTLNGLTVKIARQLKDTNIKINSVDPGFIASYPGTAEWGARPVSEGAASVIWAVTIADDGPTGGFYRDGQVMGW